MTINPEFEKLLHSSFISSFELVLNSSLEAHQWQVKSSRENESLGCAQAVVLTISSHQFRVIYFLHFNNTLPCQDYIAKELKVNRDNLTDSRFYDYLCEVGNSYFGAVKRLLGNSVTSMGMSTPNILDKSCLKYVTELDIQTSGFATAQLNGQALLYASYHLSASTELDFTVAQAVKEDVDSGELEFF
ncbi:MAG: hypothetical protein ACI9FJ_001534 [Alteromonadaceae bacterium]